MDLDITISTAAYDGYSFEEAFKSIKGIGCKQVEIAFIGGYTEAFTEDYFNDVNAKEICNLLEKSGLKCTAFSSHVDLASDDIVNIFKKRMAFAKKVGATFIVTNSASIAQKDVFYENMKELAQYAEELELYIGLENPGDGVDNLLNSGKMAPDVIAQIASKYVGINYDFGNLVSHCFEKEEPELDYIACTDQTIHYHVKDVEADSDGWHFTPIGDGAIDYKKILTDILESGNATPLSLEIPLRLRRDKNAKPERNPEKMPLETIESTLKKSVQFIDSIAKTIS